MLEYMIGTTSRNGKSLRYLRIKSDAEIGLTGDLVTFTQTQEDKVSVYEVIVGDLLREESGDGLFYRWYEVESVLVETDHTPQLAAEVEDMAQATVAASIVASRLTPHRRIGRRTPRRACGPRSPIPPKSGRSGPSPSGPMTHIAPGPRSPTLKRNGRPISTITYGSPGFTGGRRLKTWTL